MQEVQLPFTKEEYAQAERREGYSQHPVIVTIDRFLPQIALLNQGISSMGNPQESQQYIKKNYGFFADALMDAGPYTLKSLEIVAIWSKVGEVFSGRESYSLARMVAAAYAVQGASNPVWRNFPRYSMENNKLPDKVAKDIAGINSVMSKLDDIGQSQDEIILYASGGIKDDMLVAVELGKRIASGDQEARIELDKIIGLSKTYKTPLLSKIIENWGNGCSTLGMCLYSALRGAEG